MPKEKKKKKAVKPTRSKLVKKADKLFSIYTRLHYADKNGYVRCFTCWKRFKRDDRNMNCWHFISRKCFPLRWNLNNARPQCFMPCNSKLQGNWEPVLFRINLVEEIWEEKVQELENEYLFWKQKWDKVSTPQIEIIIQTLEQLIIDESKRVDR